MAAPAYFAGAPPTEVPEIIDAIISNEEVLIQTEFRQMRFALQTRDQFNHPVDKETGYEAFFNAKVVLDDTVVTCDVSYAGGGGIYVAETSMPLNTTGTFYVSIEINFLISSVRFRLHLQM